MRTASILAGALLAVAGFAAGRRLPALPPASAKRASAALSTPSPPPDLAACQHELNVTRTQLAISLALRAASRPDPTDDVAKLGAAPEASPRCDERVLQVQRINDCYTFQGMVPFYDEVLGKTELSPDEETDARALGQEECARIHHFASMARTQRLSCLIGLRQVEGAPGDGAHAKLTGPEGFKERYERFPIYERPTVAICGRWMALSASDKQALLGKMTYGGGFHVPVDAGVRLYGEELPDGGLWFGDDPR
jgi:hypothetical protein